MRAESARAAALALATHLVSGGVAGAAPAWGSVGLGLSVADPVFADKPTLDPNTYDALHNAPDPVFLFAEIRLGEDAADWRLTLRGALGHQWLGPGDLARLDDRTPQDFEGVSVEGWRAGAAAGLRRPVGRIGPVEASLFGLLAWDARWNHKIRREAATTVHEEVHLRWDAASLSLGLAAQVDLFWGLAARLWIEGLDARLTRRGTAVDGLLRAPNSLDVRAFSLTSDLTTTAELAYVF